MSRTRVAILGGGLSGLVTAWNLTAPEQQERFEVTVYQLGWRLGGKCATGRKEDESDRIQEHGLHVFMGAYQNAFHLVQQLYAVAPDPPFAGWREAFTPVPSLTLIELVDGKPVPWIIDAPIMPGTPGIDIAPSIWGRIAQMLRWIQDGFLGLDGEPPVHPPRPGWLAAMARFLRRMLGAAQDAVASAGVWLLREALELAEAIDRIDGQDPREHETLRSLLGSLRNWIARHSAERLTGDTEFRRFFILADLMLTSIVGGLADGLILNPEDNLERVNKLDYKQWLRQHGAAEITVDSAIVRGLYDLIFAYPQGRWRGDGEVEAGTMFVSLMGTACYQGAIIWKFNTATGDMIMAPLYEVLKARGVTFEFFHRVDRLVPSADGRRIESVEIGRPVTPREGGYHPLRTLPSGQRVWPDRPLFGQLVEGAALEASGANLESHWTDWPDARAPLVLQAGRDFDRLVLAIPPAAHPVICRDLIAQKRAWRKMSAALRTTATQNLQTWTTPTATQMGWTAPGMVGGYDISNLDSWADISEVLATETWPAGSGVASEQIWCGPLPCPDELPPASEHAYPARQLAMAEAAATAFLADHARFFFPGGFDANGPKPGVLVSRYDRANIDPSERYTLTVRDSTRHRLTAGGSTYDNLVLTGDWIENGQNLGSFEATTIAGMLASHALSGYPTDIRGVGAGALAKAMSGALPPEGRYVELPGDATFPGPIALDDTTMWAFVLDADIAALTRWCQASFDAPSGGEIRVLPMAGAVMMTVVDIGHGSFTEAPEMGWSRERELTFWIPAVQVEERGGRTVATRFDMVLPYLVLDNPVAIASGREIFGYRKQAGRVALPGDGGSGGALTVDLFATEPFGDATEERYRRLLTLSPTGATRAYAGESNFGAGARVLWDYLAARRGWNPSLALELQLLDTLVERRVPQLFLKQFRDVADARMACYQAITEVTAEVTRFDALPGLVEFDMALANLASSPVARDLGIAPRQRLLGARLVFDMAITPGRVLWEL